MESEARLGRMVDMTPLGPGLQVQQVTGGAALVLGPSLESSLPQPSYTRSSGQVHILLFGLLLLFKCVMPFFNAEFTGEQIGRSGL